MKVYHCTGSCAGISNMEGVCGAKSCEKHGHPLQEVELCEDCSRKMADSGELPGFCEPCKNAQA